jgi:hypothetical protein
MADKCRNCDAPLNASERYCPECGADSKAKKFSVADDVLSENARLKAELEKKKDWLPPAPAKKVDDEI